MWQKCYFQNHITKTAASTWVSSVTPLVAWSIDANCQVVRCPKVLPKCQRIDVSGQQPGRTGNLPTGMTVTFGVDPPPSSLDMTSALVTPDHNQRSLVNLSPNSWPTETVCCFKSLEEVRWGQFLTAGSLWCSVRQKDMRFPTTMWQWSVTNQGRTESIHLLYAIEPYFSFHVEASAAEVGKKAGSLEWG